MDKYQTIRAAIATLESIYETESGAEFLYETIGQTGGSLIDMLELVADALAQGNE